MILNFREIKISKTDSELTAYGGHNLKPVGKLMDLKVILNDKTRVLNCFVLPGSGSVLMGREWLLEFESWPLIFPVNTNNELNKIDKKDLHNYITQKYKKLFSDSPVQ